MPARDRSGTDQPRLWGGTTLADRRAARRQQLLASGLELLGAEHAAGLSVRAVCRRAGLTERYFYESFADRDELVAAVHDAVVEEARDTLVHATHGLGHAEEVARAAVESMVRLMVDDPSKGRVLLVAPLTEPQLTDRGLRALPVALELIRDQLSPDASPTDRDLIATGFLGAMMSLFHAYLAGHLRVTREEFVDHCVRLLLTAPQLESRPQ